MIQIPRPDDFHVHFRSGPMLRAVVPFHARHFARALVMPNRPWIGDARAVLDYRDEILRAAEACGCPDFRPLMTIALEDGMSPRTIEEASRAGAVAAKLYPLGATTGPEAGGERGIADPLSPAMAAVYQAIEAHGMILCVHAEMPPPYPRRRREREFLGVIRTLLDRHAGLKIVIEHISDAETASYLFVASGWPGQADRIGATVTAHHLIDTEDDAWESPHRLCNPIPKSERDRETLWALIARGLPNVFFGSDSAPHHAAAKHCARPACGCFTAPDLLPRLATLFEARGLLAQLGPFLAHHGADFYGLPRNQGTVTLVRDEKEAEHWIEYLDDDDRAGSAWPPVRVIVWRDGEKLGWNVTDPVEDRESSPTEAEMADQTEPRPETSGVDWERTILEMIPTPEDLMPGESEIRDQIIELVGYVVSGIRIEFKPDNRSAELSIGPPRRWYHARAYAEAIRLLAERGWELRIDDWTVRPSWL